jgi:hypothetical protein
MIAVWVMQSRKKSTLTSHDGKKSKEIKNNEEIGDHIFEKTSKSVSSNDSEFEIELEKIDQKKNNLESKKPKSKITKPKTTKVKVDRG